MRRREFLGVLGLPAAAVALSTRPGRALAAAAELAAHPGAPEEVAADESFWRTAQEAFTVDRSVINLNNGGVCPSPRLVQDAMKRHLDFSNALPAHNLWSVLEPQREGVRARLAREWGVDGEEIAITRNASEGLQICQLGFDLRPGDEVLTTTQDYPRMLTTFKQRERRDGIVLKQFSIPVPSEDPRNIVRLFEENVTPRTKLILTCHVINLTGQVLPIADIVAMGRRHGIPVIVDGAHGFAQFDFKISDLGCDYYATSLHKWLCAPHGTGLLYVRRDKIEGLWPLMAAAPEQVADIRKFEEIGTHPAANALAIAEALTFHQGMGSRRKEARLRYLRDWWAKRLLRNDRVKLHTSLDPRFSCALGTVQVDGLATTKLNQWLWDKHRILTTPIVHAEFEGVRISPNVYTTLEELDRFCSAVEGAIQHGLPA